MRKRIMSGVIFIAVFAFVSLVLSSPGAKRDKKDSLFKEVKLFSDTLSIIDAEYVEEALAKSLIYGALRGMLASLDPHSQFLTPEEYNELKVDTEGKFGGIGIEITIKDGLLTVVTPIEDTPAWKAGIKTNDRIVKIDGNLTRDMTLSEAVGKLRGKAGEAVTVTMLRENEKKVLDFKIVRDIIKINDVKGVRILEDGIGYIRLVEFRENTDKNIDAALKSLKDKGMNALILDLRNNPGGLLDVAIAVAERFIEKDKIIVSTKGRQRSANKEYFSRYKAPWVDLPVVVLINEGSASGSEIVAAAFQDYRRGIILGMKSFGKGSVQAVFPLGDGSAVRLTTSRYFTPLGRQIHGKGVMPDIVVEEGRIEITNAPSGVNQEAKEVFEQIEKKENAVKADSGLKDYTTDNQLMRAVDVLKAVRICRREK
ncbi:MAG: S41 family peptidase [Candidatus Omnitrophota bacterium]